MAEITLKMDCYGGIEYYEGIPGIAKFDDPFFSKNYTMTTGVSCLLRIALFNHYAPNTDPPVLQFTDPDYLDVYQEVPFTKVSDKVYELTTDFVYTGADSYNAMVFLRCSKKYTHVDTVVTNCQLDIASGDTMPGERTITATCDSGYEFQVVPFITDNRDHHFDFEKVSDTEYHITIDLQRDLDYTITAQAVKKTVVVDKYGMLTIYRPTKDDMKAISAKRWVQKKVIIEGGAVGTIDEYIDTAKYVVSLLKIFVQPEVTTREKLYFGPYDMGIECDVIGNDVMTLECGSVHICGAHGNSIDYDNTEIECYLPFVGFVELPTADFMDKDISLEYQINVINGDGLAVLKAGGQVAASHSCNVSFKIPYQLGGGEYQSTNIQPNTNYLLHEPPFIYVKTHNAINPDSDLPYHETNFYSTFGALTGYTEAREIDLHIVSPQITKQEIDEVKQLLENGVFL